MNLPEKSITVSVCEQQYYLSQYEDAEQSLVSDWGIKTRQSGGAMGNPGNWITFREDRTITGDLNGPVEGFWYITPRYAQNMHKPSSYRIIIENKAGEEVQWMEGSLRIKDDTSLEVNIYGHAQTFAPVDAAILARIQKASEVHLGTWTSTERSYFGSTEEYTTAYSVTFYEDGTFTAQLDEDTTGTWEYIGLNEFEDENGNVAYAWDYKITLSGIEQPQYVYVECNDYLMVKITAPILKTRIGKLYTRL